MKRFLIFFGVIFLFAFSAVYSSSTCTWTAPASGSWYTGSNWTNCSGTGGIPSSGDPVIFSASSTQNVSIPLNFPGAQAQSITITAGYTGTITQQAGETITVGSGGWSQAGGTFTGGSANITINGPFSLTGGTFTSTAGTLSIGASSTISGGTFSHNLGTVAFVSTSTTATITGSSTFYNLSLGSGVFNNSADYFFTIPTGTILTVSSSLTFGTVNSTLYLQGGGEIDAQGNILLSGSETDTTPTSTFNLVINGTGSQTINDQGHTSLQFSQLLFLPDVTINKPSGGLTLSGNIGITGTSFNNQSATTITPGNSTMVFDGTTATTTVITGSSIFNNLWFGLGVANTTSTIFQIANGTVLTAQGNLFFDTNYGYAEGYDPFQFLGGEIDVQGNIGMSYYPTYASSTTLFVANGSSTQTIGDLSSCATRWGGNGSTCNLLYIPNLTINKSTGSITLANNIALAGNFINTNGTPINPGTSTISFGEANGVLSPYPSGTTASYTISGTSTFYNFILGNYGFGLGSTVLTVPTGTTLTVQGNFQTYHPSNGSYIQYLGGGQINLQGNVPGELASNVAFPASTVQIVMNGTSTQIMGTTGSAGSNVYLPNLTISKPFNTIAYAQGTVQIGATTTISQGELNLATGTTAMSFTSFGPLIINSGARLSDYATVSSSITLSSVTNNGSVFLDGSGQACSTVLPTYVSLNSTTTNKQVPWSGSGTFVVRYTIVKDQGGSAIIPVWNGVKSGSDVGANWKFNTGAAPQLLQTATGTTNGTQVTLPAFGYYPRTGDLILVAVSSQNQNISAPTDNAGNSYQLVSSQNFGSSPSYGLSLYYAKNIMTTSTFVVTANGAGGSGPLLSAAAFEYTGMAPSSTFDTSSTNMDTSGNATSFTSFSASGRWINELYFGAMTLANSTVITPGTGWTAEGGVTNNVTNQALYTEDVASTSLLTTAATWTSAPSSSYAATLGLFRAPYVLGYAASGTLDSATFDTGVANGAQLNSFVWQGATPADSNVGFQFAVSNSSNGPWNFEGPDGTSNTYFSGIAGASINLLSTTNGYALFNGNRYFRYRAILFSSSGYIYTPTVSQVVVNWSP